MCAVEAMNFVHEQQGPLAAEPALAGSGKGLAQIRHARKHRRQLFEMQPHMRRQQPRNGGLAAAGRSPQHQRGQAAGRQHAANGAVLGQQMILADYLVQFVRSQPFRQGPQGALIHARAFEQVAHKPNRMVRTLAPRFMVICHSFTGFFMTSTKSSTNSMRALFTCRILSPGRK